MLTKFRVWKDYTAQFEYFTLEDVLRSTEDDLQRMHNAGAKGFEQWVGLYDNSDVPVYKGDFQKVTSGAHYFIYLVTDLGGQFGNQLFSICVADNMATDEQGDCYTFKERIHGKRGSYRAYVRWGKDCTVIGNVHENQELVEKYL